MLPHKTFDSSQFVRREPLVVRLAHRRQPELRRLSLPDDVNVWRFISIARKEKEPIRALPQDCRTHPPDCRSFRDECAITSPNGIKKPSATDTRCRRDRQTTDRLCRRIT